MAINENIGTELEENQQQPSVTLTRGTSSNSTTVLTLSRIYQRQNQQEEPNSPSDFNNNTNIPSDFYNESIVLVT